MGKTQRQLGERQGVSIVMFRSIDEKGGIIHQLSKLKSCINLPLNPNRFPNIGAIYISVRHNTCVTHVWITAEKSCGEFSAAHAHACRNLVLFLCDDSVVSLNIFQTHLGVEESSHLSCFQNPSHYTKTKSE